MTEKTLARKLKLPIRTIRTILQALIDKNDNKDREYWLLMMALFMPLRLKISEELCPPAPPATAPA